MEQERVIAFIEKISKSYPYVGFRYEINTDTGAHVIEVAPESFLKKDIQFAQEQFDFVTRFLKDFPLRSVYFVAPNDLVKVTGPCIEFGPNVSIGFNLNDYATNISELLLSFQIDPIQLWYKSSWSKLGWEKFLEGSDLRIPETIRLEHIPVMFEASIANRIKKDFKMRAKYLPSETLRAPANPNSEFDIRWDGAGGESNYAMAA